jgi:hypothetical protein
VAWRLVAADLAALVAFTVLGARLHGAAVGWDLLLRTFLPLATSWGLVASVLGTYRTGRWTTFVVTWAVAIPLGILLRQALAGRLGSPGTWAFLLVGTATSGLLLALARLVVWRFARPG